MNETDKIMEVLENASGCDNLCNEILTLKEFEKEYKKTAFYKSTKMPLLALYREYQHRRLLSFEAIFKNAQELVHNLDVDTLAKALEKITGDLGVQIENFKKEFEQSDLMDIINKK